MEGKIPDQPCPKCGAMLGPAKSGADSAGARCPVCSPAELPPDPPVPVSPASTLKGSLVVFGFGLGMTLLGVTLLYLQGYKPYHDAIEGAPSVQISFSAALMGPFFAVLGVIVMLPLPKPSKDGRNRLRTLFQYAALAAIILGFIAGVGGYFWLRHFLKGRGYDF